MFFARGRRFVNPSTFLLFQISKKKKKKTTRTLVCIFLISFIVGSSTTLLVCEVNKTSFFDCKKKKKKNTHPTREFSGVRRRRRRRCGPTAKKLDAAVRILPPPRRIWKVEVVDAPRSCVLVLRVGRSEGEEEQGRHGTSRPVF